MGDLIRIENNMPVLNKDVSIQIAELEKRIKFLKAEEERIKAAILYEMGSRSIKSIKTEELTISYFDDTYTEYFNKDKFREENPDLYDKYVEIHPKKAFVKIGVK